MKLLHAATERQSSFEKPFTFHFYMLLTFVFVFTDQTIYMNFMIEWYPCWHIDFITLFDVSTSINDKGGFLLLHSSNCK